MIQPSSKNISNPSQPQKFSSSHVMIFHLARRILDIAHSPFEPLQTGILRTCLQATILRMNVTLNGSCHVGESLNDSIPSMILPLPVPIRNAGLGSLNSGDCLKTICCLASIFHHWDKAFIRSLTILPVHLHRVSSFFTSNFNLNIKPPCSPIL